MKYLKLFTSHSDYNAAQSSLDKPNVSHCVNENEVHYNKKIITKIRYNASAKLVETTSSSSSGLHTNAFIGENGQLNIISHTFENGIGTVIIDGSVITIGNYAFKKSTITAINIPDSVTNIGDEAFCNCTSLASITIPDSVTGIGDEAFYYCSGLTSLTLSNNIASIGEKAFYGCSSLTNLTIPNSVTSIDDDAFSYCRGLTSVTIGNSVTSISQAAFSSCTNLTSVTIPDSVTSIGSSAFNGCNSLTSITIGSGVTRIYANVFKGCSSLTNITSLAMTAPTIYSGTFENVKTGGTLTVPVGSTGYDVWMGTGDYYLGKYNWTKVEQ